MAKYKVFVETGDKSPADIEAALLSKGYVMVHISKIGD